MKKSLLALTLLGAFAGVAQAQSAVVIYGTVDAGLIKRTDQTLQIGKRANNTLGFKGTEDIGNGLKALFQLEIRYEPDTGSIEQGAGGVTRPLFQGQSRVGLQGGFGTVRIGRGLTPFQEVITQYEPFHGLPTPAGFQTDLQVAGYTSDRLGQPGNSTNRFSNALFYNTPENLGGFSAFAAVATKEAGSNTVFVGRGTVASPQYPANAEASANPFSIVGQYKNGPVSGMLAYERNAVESKLMSVAASVMVVPELKLMASYQRQNESHSKAFDTKTKAWIVGANYTMGAGKILAGYGQKTPDNSLGNPALVKTKQFSLGYEYSLSKRTYLYADASNRKAASSLNIYALGINHSF